MTRNHSSSKYSRIVDDYAQHLRDTQSNHLNLTQYCIKRNVCLKSVTQWMVRNGITVSQLKSEAFPDLYSPVTAEFVYPDNTEKTIFPIVFHRNSTSKHPSSDNSQLIKGVSITFPDGVIVTIKEISQPDLNQFIHSYNNQ